MLNEGCCFFFKYALAIILFIWCLLLTLFAWIYLHLLNRLYCINLNVHNILYIGFLTTGWATPALYSGACMWVPLSLYIFQKDRDRKHWPKEFPTSFSYHYYLRLKVREWVDRDINLTKIKVSFVSALIDIILNKWFHTFLCVCNTCTERIENWDVNIYCFW